MAKPEIRSNHSTTDDLARSAHDAVDSIAETAAYAEENIRAASTNAKERLRAGKERAQEKGVEVTDNVRSYVSENPLMAIGAAFAVGVMLSSLMRR